MGWGVKPVCSFREGGKREPELNYQARKFGNKRIVGKLQILGS